MWLQGVDSIHRLPTSLPGAPGAVYPPASSIPGRRQLTHLRRSNLTQLAEEPGDDGIPDAFPADTG